MFSLRGKKTHIHSSSCFRYCFPFLYRHSEKLWFFSVFFCSCQIPKPRSLATHFYINKLAAFCNHNLFLCLAFFVSLGIVCVCVCSVSLCAHPSWWRWCVERYCNNSHFDEVFERKREKKKNGWLCRVINSVTIFFLPRHLPSELVESHVNICDVQCVQLWKLYYFVQNTNKQPKRGKKKTNLNAQVDGERKKKLMDTITLNKSIQCLMLNFTWEYEISHNTNTNTNIRVTSNVPNNRLELNGREVRSWLIL